MLSMEQRSRSTELTINSGDRKGGKDMANPILVTGAGGRVGKSGLNVRGNINFRFNSRM